MNVVSTKCLIKGYGEGGSPSNQSYKTDLKLRKRPPRAIQADSSMFAELEKAETLVHFRCLIDSDQAGTELIEAKRLLNRFLEKYSRKGAKETKDGYWQEERHFVSWDNQNYPQRHMRVLDIVLMDDWISQLRKQLGDRGLEAQAFHRRISELITLNR